MRRCWQAVGWVWLLLPHMDHGKTSPLDFMRNTETGMAMGFMSKLVVGIDVGKTKVTVRALVPAALTGALCAVDARQGVAGCRLTAACWCRLCWSQRCAL